MSFQVIRDVVNAGTPGGWTAFTAVGGTLTAVLSDASDSTYIESSDFTGTARSQLAYAIFEDINLPAGAVIEWIAPIVRESHDTGCGFITVAEMHATNGAGWHRTSWSLAQTGANPADAGFADATGAIYTAPFDGTAWSDCFPTTFTAVIAWGPRWRDSVTFIPTAPKLAEVWLLISYRMPPVVTISSPSGSISDPRAPVSWETVEEGDPGLAEPFLDTRQEAYRLMVVPDGAVDGAAVAAGDPGFDPTTSDTITFDSGKTYSSETDATVTDHLILGTDYWFYVQAWSPSIGRIEMPSLWEGVGPYGITSSAVVAPTVSVAEDPASYSMFVTVTRVAPGGGQVAPNFYSLQRLEGTVWVEVPGAQRLSGAGPWVVADSTQTPGTTVTYRARGIYLASATVEWGSVWVSDSASFEVRYEWWLKDTVDPTMNMAIEVADYSETIPKPQEVAYGAGATGATVTHQGVRSGVHKVSIRTLDATTYAGVRALLETGRTLVLCSVFGDAWKVQLADSAEVRVIRAMPAAGEVTPIRAARMLTCTFTEVDR